jgi:hypothetical protein
MCAVCLYANGLTEELRSKEYTFTESEIYNLFEDFDKLRSYRLYEIPNTWCVWGERDPIDKASDEYSQVGSDIIEQSCYSPVLFVHDTEIDPLWRLSDNPIIFGYDDFKKELLAFFNEVARDMLEERERIREESGKSPSLMVMEQIGISDDKRIIFKFDMNKQIEEFFSEKNLSELAGKVHTFLKFSYKDGEIFAVHADKNIIIVIDDSQVKPFIEKIIGYFQHHENYEACSVIRNVYDRWIKYKTSKIKKQTRKKSSRIPKRSGDPDNPK